MKVRLASYADWRKECEILVQMHFLEVLQPRGYSFELNHDFFENAEDQGGLRIIIAYDDNSLPIGYAKTIISEGVFSGDYIFAHTASFYLHPEHRKGRAGLSLLRAVEADVGATCPGASWRISIPIDGDRDIGMVLERGIGAKPIERMYQKIIPGGGTDE